MPRPARRILPLAATLALLAACADLPLQRVDQDLHNAVATEAAAPKLAPDANWRRDPAADAQAQRRVTELLADGLSVDEAVRLALVANPDLQIELEQLGVARAVWLEASQLANPLLGWSHRGLKDGPGANVELSVAQDLLSVFQLPGRRRSADAALQSARLAAAQAVIALATSVRQQYWRSVVADELAANAARREQLGQLMYELAERYHSAGNLSLVERETYRDQSMLVRAEAERARSDATRQRAALLRLLGVTGSHDDATLTDKLPALPASDPSTARAGNARIAPARGSAGAAAARRCGIAARLAGEALALAAWRRSTVQP